MEELLDNTAFTVNFILQLILLIVFLRMAWNIGRIRKFLIKESFDMLLSEANKLEFKGKTDEAIDKCLDYLYLTMNTSMEVETKKSMIKPVVERINKLGGKVPDSIKDYL